MIKAALGKSLDTLSREVHASRNKVRVNATLCKQGDEVFQILPQRRLTTRKMRLQNAKVSRLRKHRQPRLRVEFICRLQNLIGFEQ